MCAYSTSDATETRERDGPREANARDGDGDAAVGTPARAPPPLVRWIDSVDVLCDQWDDADDGGGDAERDRVRTIVDRESDRGATVTATRIARRE